MISVVAVQAARPIQAGWIGRRPLLVRSRAVASSEAVIMSFDFSNAMHGPLAPAAVASEWLTLPAPPIRSILVPLDGSPNAEHALPHALALVRENGGMVRIVQVYSYQEEVFSRNSLWSDDDPIRTIREPHERYLRGIVRRISRTGDIPVIATLIESDVPATTLQRLQGETDLTVMTSRRRNWFSRLCRASLVDAMLDRPSRPVLLVRGYDAPVDLTGDPVCGHVLLPVSPVDDVSALVAALPRLGRTHRPLVATLLPLSRQNVAVTAAWAARHRGETPGLDVRAQTKPAETVRAVLDFADREEVDLIAVTLERGLGSFSPAGSELARSIAAQSTLPVLVQIRCSSRANSAAFNDVVITPAVHE